MEQTLVPTVPLSFRLSSEPDHRAALPASDLRGEARKACRVPDQPKNRAGEDRIVDLDTVSSEVLKTWRATQQREMQEWGYKTKTENVVFTRENGEPLDPGRTYFEFVRLVQEAGLSHLKVHGLRHLNLSLQLEAGVSETIVAMRIGHTSPALIRSTPTFPQQFAPNNYIYRWHWAPIMRLTCGNPGAGEGNRALTVCLRIADHR